MGELKHPNTGRLDPDAPHHYQPRKVTWKGRRAQPVWIKRRSGGGYEYRIPLGDGVNAALYDAQMPCRHCGGSEGIPNHVLAESA